MLSPDRTAADHSLDPGRKPLELLRFLGVGPGMRIGELGAVLGYTTELLAHAVSPGGIVYAQNPRFVLERFAARPWAARLARPVNRDVVRCDREFDGPFPPEARDLDLVLSNANYHDAVWTRVDRTRMNRAVFDALKSGGRYVLSDSSARPGTGEADAQSLHRIDEALVRAEVEGAGFELRRTGDFLRNAADARDWSSGGTSAGDRRGTSDRFVLEFAKP